MRCLALFTGGLDSQLAVRLVQRQGIEVVGLHVTTPLCSDDGDAAKDAAARLGIELLTADASEAFCQVVRQPRFGRVAGAATCLDCRITVFATASSYMTDCAADFVVSGEVIGQRPRTAVRELEVVAHHAGLDDQLLRPLSAGLLPATLPERRGWLDRTRLASIQGKGRKQQLRLAAALGVDPIPSPRPECPLLAEPLAGRVLEMLHERSELSPWNLSLSAIGRHFRASARVRIVVGRNQAESQSLRRMADDCPQCLALEPAGFMGPIVLIVGDVDETAREEALRLMARHGRHEGPTIRGQVTRAGQSLGTWETAATIAEGR